MRSNVLTYCWTLLITAVVAQKDRGYIFTCSKSLDVGTTETCYLTLYNVPATGTVTLRLRKQHQNEVLAKTEAKINAPSPATGQTIMLNLTIPVMQTESVKLQLTGSFATPDAYKINKTSEVNLREFGNDVLIQTDKPLYKPGQAVKIRLLPIDNQLRPLTGQTFGDVWLENPSGVRLAQWLNVSFAKGMAQVEMKLAEEPVLGTWTITANVSGIVKMQTFSVEEYVLPKFEVLITPPPYVLASANDITWEICGKYSYGKLVNGNISLRATYETYQWDRVFYPVVKHEGPIEGCYNFTVNESDLSWKNSSYRYRSLKLFAEVTEVGTDVSQNATASARLTNNPVEITFQNDASGSEYFKPGIPYHGSLIVKSPDGKPKPNEIVEVSTIITETKLTSSRLTTTQSLAFKNFTSDENGIISFTIPPQTDSTKSVQIQAIAVNYPQRRYHDHSIMIYQPQQSTRLSPWYSPSNSFIQIETEKKELACDAKGTFKVLYTEQPGTAIKFFLQIMSRGRIVSATNLDHPNAEIQSLTPDKSYIIATNVTNNKTYQIGKFDVPFQTAYYMSPVAHLLVYYVRTNGEIVADSQDVDITKCLKNKVKMEFTSSKQLPGTDVGIKLTASPNSLCGISAVDKSVYYLRSDNRITEDRLFQTFSQYDIQKWAYPQQNDPTRCPYRSYYRRKRAAIIRPSVPWPPSNDYTNYADALTAFNNGGFLVLTDLKLETKPCQRNDYPPVPYYSEDESLSYDEETPFSLSSAMGGSGGGGGGGAIFDSAPQTFSVNSLNRNGVARPEAIPQAAPGLAGPSPPTSSKPVVEVRDYFPETWLWEMEQVDNKGEALVKRTLPHTITEWVGDAICIHPRDGLGISSKTTVTGFQAFFVSFTLPYSVVRGEVLPCIVSVFNYLQDCLNIKVSLDKSDKFELVGNVSAVTMNVCGGKSGTHNFLVRPKALGQLKFTVRAFTEPGGPNAAVSKTQARDAATNSLIVLAEGFPREKVFSTFFCPKKIANGIFKTNYDLLLPDNVVADSGRAEFAVTGDLMGPTLKNIDKLVLMPTGCGEQNLLNFVPDIYILKYLTETGRLTKDLQTKLLDYLKQGYQRQLTYRHTDGSYSAFGNSDQEGSMWLTGLVVKAFYGASKYVYVDKGDLTRSTTWITAKQQPDGCFPEIGKVLHSAMKGGLESTKGSAATLTAYVLISLLESNYNNTQVVNKAFNCLAQETNPSVYSLALITYASCLANHSTAKQQLEKLMAKATTDGDLVYWKDTSAAIEVELASYVILSLLSPAGGVDMERALPIVRWISTKRNANGGFISTQDTVMALQALATYASYISKDPVDINVHVEGTDVTEDLHVDESNKLLMQVVPVPHVPTPLEVTGNGTGCGLTQATLKYNIQAPPNQKVFELVINTVRGVNKSCKKADITSCIGFNLGGRMSNMAVLELRLVSGYTVDKSSVEPLKDDQSLFLKRSEVDGNTLALYFSQVGQAKKCFTIRAEQEFEVQDLKPGIAKLYDYYEPEKQVSVSYTIDAECTPPTEPTPTIP